MHCHLENLVTKFAHLAKISSVFSKVKELPESLLKALREVNYNKGDIQLEPAESISPSGVSSEGKRCFFMLVSLDTGEYKITYGSWGGPGLGSRNNMVDLDETSHPLTPGIAAIKGSVGYPATYATIYLHPDNITKLLTTVDERLSPRDRWLLYTFDGLTSAGRKDEWQYNNDVPSEDDLNRLSDLGYLKRSKNGATKITTEGKNVLNRKPGYSINHPSRKY